MSGVSVSIDIKTKTTNKTKNKNKKDRIGVRNAVGCAASYTQGPLFFDFSDYQMPLLNMIFIYIV